MQGDGVRVVGWSGGGAVRASRGGEVGAWKFTGAATQSAHWSSATGTPKGGSMKPIACGSKESDLPLSRFPLRGQAGGTAASAALRLGHSTGPKQNAHPRSGPVRKRCSVVGGLCPQTPAL